MKLLLRQIKYHRVPWNSMEQGGPHFEWHRVPWNSMELGNIWFVLPNQIQLSFIEFHGTWDYCFNHYKVPLYFNLIFHRIHGTLLSPNQNSPSSMGFHGIRKAPFKMTQMFHGIPWNIPWNSMELWCRQMKYHSIPRNSMELWDCHFIQYHVTLHLHGLFHGILESPSKKNHRGFHGIRRAPFQKTQVFYGIPWNILRNSMELWCRQMKYHLVPWNSRELWDCHFIQYHVTMDFHVIFHGIPWNSGVAK